MKRLSLAVIVVMFGVGLGSSRSSAAEAAASQVQFNRDIRPILSDTCFTCHGPDAGARESDLRLDVKESAFADLGGYRAIVPGDIDASELITRITSDDPDLRMPPPDSGRQLTAAQIEMLKRWIEQDAAWQQHWSFAAPQASPLPNAKELNAWCTNPIDRFIAARLADEGLSPSPAANKETLIRRVTLDLTGLPPTLAEVDAFLADESPDAYTRLVDRLLSSPRYGEHMAAPWLDAARYSDTNGYQQDRTRTMWPWRDWVIDALNRNMPFDQFTIEQIAGDLLPDARPRQLLASGFNRNHPLNGEGGRIAEESRVEYVVDRVETTSTVWLGLTAGCARCHDHKYDPLSQQEFYDLYAFFNSIDESGRVDAGGNAKPVMKLPSRDQLQTQRRLTQQIAEIESRLQSAPEEEKYAAWQAQLRRRLEDEQHDLVWLPVEPVKFTSDQGQELELWDDGSIYVSGKNPANDSYTIVLKTKAKNVRGLRLEALAHDSFTNGGIARSDSGNFVLTEIEVSAASGDSGNQQPIKIAAAQADYEQGGFPVADAYDGNPKSGWAVHHPADMKIDRRAKFIFDKPIPGGETTTLTVRLKHDSVHRNHNLGRFRLSVTTRENPPLTDGESDVPANIIAAINTPSSERSQTQRRQLADYYRRTSPEFAPLREELAKANKQLENLRKSFPEVMVMSERSQPRETFVLKVGQYDQPDRDRPAQPGTPAVLPPLGDDAASRLELAKWLVDPAHPLTARVTVNRIWQHHFGVGLVKTSEDFGVQGERPSHPELLDWLALELVRSGWDMKHLHRLIVASCTYRQSSRVTPEWHARDPANRLLARGPRFRLNAFAIRDQALALAGLLVERTGGEPVKPYQPPGVWDDFSLGKIKYQRDTGEKLYRRSIYTFWRRSVGPTTFFDTANRLVCDVRPRRTNTPLHALTTLNDTAYVEAARLFAERMMTAGGDTPDERLHWAFRTATARQPTHDELAVLNRAFQRAQAKFTEDPQAAADLLAVGEMPRNEKLPAEQLAAYTAVANLILNLDEVVTRE